MTGPGHHSLYRSLPLALGGLLGSLLLLIAGIAGVLPSGTSRALFDREAPGA